MKKDYFGVYNKVFNDTQDNEMITFKINHTPAGENQIFNITHMPAGENQIWLLLQNDCYYRHQNILIVYV